MAGRSRGNHQGAPPHWSGVGLRRFGLCAPYAPTAGYNDPPVSGTARLNVLICRDERALMPMSARWRRRPQRLSSRRHRRPERCIADARDTQTAAFRWGFRYINVPRFKSLWPSPRRASPPAGQDSKRGQRLGLCVCGGRPARGGPMTRSADERTGCLRAQMFGKPGPPEVGRQVSHVVGDYDRRWALELVPDDCQSGVALVRRKPTPGRGVQRVSHQPPDSEGVGDDDLDGLPSSHRRTGQQVDRLWRREPRRAMPRPRRRPLEK